MASVKQTRFSQKLHDFAGVGEITVDYQKGEDWVYESISELVRCDRFPTAVSYAALIELAEIHDAYAHLPCMWNLGGIFAAIRDAMELTVGTEDTEDTED